jgi:hypothetical protein
MMLPRHALSYMWAWFFPVTVSYMILVLPRHCLKYDPDSSPSLSYMMLILPCQYLVSWCFPVMHCLICEPDSSPSLSYIWSWYFPVMHCLIYIFCMILTLSRHALSYIWSWFFPVTVLYMILILPRHCHIWCWFFPVSTSNCIMMLSESWINSLFFVCKYNCNS